MPRKLDVTHKRYGRNGNAHIVCTDNVDERYKKIVEV